MANQEIAKKRIILLKLLKITKKFMQAVCMLHEIILLTQKGALTLQILRRIKLSYLKSPKISLLPSLNLILAVENSEPLIEVSVEGYALYALTGRQITTVSIADPSDSKDGIRKLLRRVIEFLENTPSGNQYLEDDEKFGLDIEIRNIVKEIIPSERVRGIVREITKSEDTALEPAKFVFLGLSQAGKSSIYKYFFEKASKEELDRIEPTILREIHRPKVEIAKERIAVFDLGGQTQYLPLHLADEGIFSEVTAIIFVVDVQEPKRFDEAAQYFFQVVNLIQNQKEKPTITVMLHKFDPENHDELLPNMSKAMTIIGPILQPLQPVFFFTSIFDKKSIDTALTNVLFRGLPVEVLEQTLRGDIFLDTFERFIPIYESISKEQNFEEEQAKHTLREFSKAVGGELAKHLTSKWYQILCEGRPFESIASEILIDIRRTDVIRFEITCPLPKEKQIPIYCSITGGILEGLACSLGLGSVDCIRTMAINNAPSCVFVAGW